MVPRFSNILFDGSINNPFSNTMYQKQRPISALSYSIKYLAHPRKFKVSMFYITPKAHFIMAIVAQVNNVALGPLVVFLTLSICSFF